MVTLTNAHGGLLTLPTRTASGIPLSVFIEFYTEAALVLYTDFLPGAVVMPRLCSRTKMDTASGAVTDFATNSCDRLVQPIADKNQVSTSKRQ